MAFSSLKPKESWLGRIGISLKVMPEDKLGIDLNVYYLFARDDGGG